jgi:hypothetical protein
MNLVCQSVYKNLQASRCGIQVVRGDFRVFDFIQSQFLPMALAMLASIHLLMG